MKHNASPDKSKVQFRNNYSSQSLQYSLIRFYSNILKSKIDAYNLFDNFYAVSNAGCCSCLELPLGRDLLPSHHETSGQHDTGYDA